MVVTAVFAVAAGLLVYLNQGPEYAISTEVIARLPSKIQLVARRLVGEPCNRTLEAELVSSTLERAEYGALVSFSEQTATKAGQMKNCWQRSSWLTFALPILWLPSEPLIS
jgi:hypothetical protein